MRHNIAGITLLFMLFAQSVLAGEPALIPVKQPLKKKAVEILVKYSQGSRFTKQSGYLGKLPALQCERFCVPKQQTAEAMAKSRQADPQVEWVQPNYWRYALATEVVPDDPYYRPEQNQRQYQQWYLSKVNANFAWSVADGSENITVAVVDSGVDLNHPDLKNRLVRGATLVSQEDYSPTSEGMDDHGHGTHVAGIIAAQSNNNLGISGCAWKGKIMPIKVLNNKGEGLDSDIAVGIRWAVDAGAKIINLSLGGYGDDGSPPPVLQEAVDYAYSQGCLVIAAAGNTGDNTVHYPGALEHVIAVAATDPWDQRAAYSTYGSYVDLAAPGGAGADQFSRATGMLSTYWNENSHITDKSSGSEAGEYAIMAGTSFAAAVVSGAALVVWGNQPSYTVDEVENVLLDSAVDVGAIGADIRTGNGRIDLLAALGNPVVERTALTSYNYPNPFYPEKDTTTRIVFFLDEPAETKVRIYDSARELVWHKKIAAAETLAGKNTLTWDGTNDLGQRVANGVYFYRLTTAPGLAGKLKTIAVVR
ncbi:S8 family serine peptidase [bacterium]|nr:S8 family serine peptidase [bacterium]